MDGEQDIGWPLGPLELRILRAVWSRGSGTVREILAEIAPEHPIAYTTAMTVMGRLAEKGLLRRELTGKTYRYAPTVTPEEFAASVSQRMVRSLVAEFGELAIAQFSRQLDRVDPDRLRRLREATEGVIEP